MNKFVKEMGLSYDPFAAAEKSRTFFTGGGRQALLQRLLEQAHFGAPLSMVCGTLGSGKTTLAREFRASFSNEALCIPVHATLFMNQHQFLEALLEQLPVGASSPEPAAIVDDLVRFADKLYLDARTLVIIVDDAHELASEVLEIVDALTNKANEGAVHILMLGEMQLSNMLHGSLGNNAISNRLSGRILEEHLESLGNDEALEYIGLKLTDAGYIDDLPLQSSVVGEIINEANGIPGAINVLVTDALNNKMQPIEKPAEQSQSLLQLGANYWATAAGLIVCLLAAVIFLPSGSEDADGEEVATAEAQGNRMQIPLAVNRSQVVNSPAERAVVASSSGAVTNSPARNETPNSEQDRSAIEANAPVTQTIAPDADEANKPVAPAISASAPSTIPTPAPTPSGSASGSDTARFDQPGMSEFERELLSYDAGHFTLQIMGSRSEEAVQRFVERELSAFNHGYFEARHEGNPWFVVVSGHFTSRAAANRALADLPANIRNMEPWIRSLGDVQAAIASAHPGIAAQ